MSLPCDKSFDGLSMPPKEHRAAACHPVRAGQGSSGSGRGTGNVKISLNIMTSYW